MGATKRAAEMVIAALARSEPAHPLHGGALRQRARLERQRDPEVQGADRPRRAGDGDPPGDHALLHDHSRGGAAGAAGRGDRRDRPGLRARHGRAGEDRRPGARPDPPGRALAGGRSPIDFTGLRPGEKLYEELLADADRTLPTTVAELRIAVLQQDDGRIDELLALAEGAAPTRRRRGARGACSGGARVPARGRAKQGGAIERHGLRQRQVHAPAGRPACSAWPRSCFARSTRCRRGRASRAGCCCTRRAAACADLRRIEQRAVGPVKAPLHAWEQACAAAARRAAACC